MDQGRKHMTWCTDNGVVTHEIGFPAVFDNNFIGMLANQLIYFREMVFAVPNRLILTS